MSEIKVHPLRRAREKYGVTQKALGELTGLGSATIGRSERDEPLSPYSIAQICEYFSMRYNRQVEPQELGLRTKWEDNKELYDSKEKNSGGQEKISGLMQKNMQGESDTIGLSGIAQEIAPLPANSFSILTKEQATIPVPQSLTVETGNTFNRQVFLRGAVGVTGTLLFASNDLLITELLERCTRALKKPSTIDVSLLSYIERRTATHWQDRHGAVLSSHDLFSYVLEHFQRVVSLFEGSLLPSARERLCSTVSEIAQLAGHLLFDIGDYIKAREFHTIAITAAQEANDTALQAVAWGRMSFTWTYSGNPQKALECIQEAQRLAWSVNSTVFAYLAAVEAEIQALLGDREACLKALGNAENFEEHQYSNAESYWLRFDRSRLAGYKGICFQRLYSLENNPSASLLTEAQKALMGALEQLSPTRIQRRPVLLVDLASIFAKQGAVEAACEYAAQAMSITTQARSRTVLQHLLVLRQELVPWEETSHVKALDERISSLLVSGR